MFKNYFKITWRNLIKNKTFSSINIFGLCAGLVCCMMISVYILHETSYDKYQANADNIYQVGTTFVSNGEDHRTANTPAPVGAALQQDFPAVQQSVRLMSLFAEDKTLIQYNIKSGQTKSFYETRGFLTDSTFFRMFTYNFIEGNAANALNEPRTAVLSEEIAKKLFGSESALNKLIHISSSTNGDNDFLVTGVFRPNDHPSHIDGKFFLSMNGGDIENYIKRNGASFATNNMFFTYIKLRKGADPKKIEAQFPAFIDKYAGKELASLDFKKKQFLLPLTKIHLESGVDNDITPSGSLTYLYILGSIALFTLLIACINFMNLSTARSSKRSAEVGIRKVLGAQKNSLIRQFLGESIFMSFLAFLLAILITIILLPAFNAISGKNISVTLEKSSWLFAAFLLMSVFAGLLAGSYPAFYLSSFRPVKVLKGKFSNSLAAISLRKGLVVFQFIISVVLIIASVVIAGQMQYLRSADLGFEKDRQVIIPLRSQVAKKIGPALKADLKKLSGIEDVGESFYNPGRFNPSDNSFYKQGQTMQDGKRTRLNGVDENYLQTLNLRVVAGRLFSAEFPSDTANRRIILNETAIKEIGFKNAKDAVGKKIYTTYNGETNDYDVIGVVNDFHFEDLHLPITPFGFMRNNDGQYNYMLVHAAPGNIGNLLRSIGDRWKKFNPNEPFEYSFLDQDFQRNYESEIRIASIVNYFTIIAILISCLGLFGLATFSAEQRIKEIGVRKVLGASVANIVTLLSKDFLKLVMVSIIIASPIAWFVMNKWLQDFAYRININWVVFAITTLVALFIAIATISFQAIRAAIANPVKSLRTE